MQKAQGKGSKEIWLALISGLVILLLIAIVLYANQPQQVQTSAGQCSMLKESSDKGLVTCHTGETLYAWNASNAGTEDNLSGYGFKLLGVDAGSAQVSIYNDCYPCEMPVGNPNAHTETISVSVGGHFGGACASAPYSELLSTNTTTETASFEVNTSKYTGVCA